MTYTATLPDLATLRDVRNEAALRVLENAGARKNGAGGIKGLAIGRSDVFFVSPYDVHVEDGWNGRDFNDPENIAHVERLKESVKARGVEEPLTLRRGDDGRFYLVNGECRLRGVLGAIADGVPVESIPVRLSSAKATNAERIASQITLNTGKPFSPMEMARLCKRLEHEEGWSREQIASHLGSLTKERIGQLLALLEMPEPVQAQVAAGTVSATEAARVVQKHGEEAAEIIERAAALPPEEGGGNKPGRATRAALEAVTSAPEPSEPRLAPLTLARVLRILREAVAVEDGASVEVTIPLEDWEAISAAF